jgi:hypothetical protein
LTMLDRRRTAAVVRAQLCNICPISLLMMAHFHIPHHHSLGLNS